MGLAAIFGAWATQARAQSDAGTPPDLTGLSLEQLAELDIVYAVSKHPESKREAPSAVTVVGAQEIRQFGYRTLADVLRSVPGFYVTDDRNYSYVGVRGFDRPGDYSTRILLLLDGLRTNDNVYDTAFVGEEFVLDADLIDRIEVIRGPGASIYGNNAFFAVINVVTKRGHDLNGAEAAASAGTSGAHKGRTSWGRRFRSGFEALFSATVSGRDGERLFFQEFDAPETNHGITQGTDGESFDSQFASLSMKGGFLEAARVSREKGIPTGAYETDFNDPRNRTRDESTLVQAGYEGSMGREVSTVARLHYGRYAYTGTYMYTGIETRDLGRGEWWGLDWNATWSGLPRQVLTFGGEYQDSVRQDQASFDVAPLRIEQEIHHRSTRWGVFLQDAVTLRKGLRLHSGLRHDRYETFGAHTSPRLGLVGEVGPATTLKLLYGTAFRAPNEYELHYEAFDHVANPNLRPETIRTLEAVLERRLGPDLRISASAFQNRIKHLISIASETGTTQFRNAEAIHSGGIELSAEARRGRATLRGSYSLQRTTEAVSGLDLTNSPRHMAKLNLGLPLARGLSTGIETQYMSGRQTLAGRGVGGFFLANATLLAPRLFGRLDASASVHNILDLRYGDPGSEEHLEDAIPQLRRSLRFKLVVHF